MTIFLFSNYHFTRYVKKTFINNITSNRYYKQNKIEMPHISPERLQGVELFPQYIIDDDMYDIWIYFLAASYLTHQLNAKRSAHIIDNNPFMLKVVVIPHRVVSIYDKNVVFEHSIKNISRYLKQKKLKADTKTIKKSSQIQNIVQTQMSAVKAKKGKIKNLLFIIDRREMKAEHDKIYFIALKHDPDNKCAELDANYFISLQFQVTTTPNQKITKCYFRYGLNNREKIRFYPEYLTSTMPRFFQKNNQLNYYENAQALYDDKYKHGFAVNLDDPEFNKHYKIVTNWEHISLNYNRNVVKPDDMDEYAYQHEQYHNMNQIHRRCDITQKLAISECPFIAYIIDSLTLFRNIDYQVHYKNEKHFNLQYLSECYNHIICIHSFCSNNSNREKIQCHIGTKMKKCDMRQKCIVVKHQYSRTREENKRSKFKSAVHKQHHNILLNVLQTCLESLHYYLFHDEGNHRRVRFVVKKDPLQFSDEIDDFIEFIAKSTQSTTFVSQLNDWLIQEQFDWESILNDISIDMNEIKSAQSNIYLLLKEHQKNSVFDSIYRKYHKTECNKHNNVNVIQTGISALCWLEYGDEPKHKTFIDEILFNEHSTITDTLLEEYKAKCSILMNTTQVTYKYTLNELLALKLYTDTDLLCSKFRKAHWNDNNLIRLKREFYWWGINIYKAALYHSRPLPRFSMNSTKPMNLYHGINTVLAVTERTPKYSGPVSTTLVDTVAHQFSDGVGLLFEMKTTYCNPFNFIKGIDVSWISCHKQEAEILLIDQYLHITTTIDFSDNDTKIKHLFKKLTIYKNKITDKADFWKTMGFNLNDELMSVVKQQALLQYSKYTDENQERKTILHRLFEELEIADLTDEYELFASHIRMKYTPLIIDCELNMEENPCYNDGIIQLYSAGSIHIASKGEIANIHTDRNNTKQYQSLIFLVSANDIIINGTLSSNINGDNGTIALLAEKKVVINGQILCGKNGKILICCKSLQNNSMPKNELIVAVSNHKINENTNEAKYILKYTGIDIPNLPWQISEKHQTPITLSIYKYSGYYSNNECYHPNNLLDGSKHTYYKSEVSHDDWIIFEIKNGPIHLTKVQIRNCTGNGAIRDIEIHLGSNKIEIEYHQLCSIDNIENNKQLQEFYIEDHLKLSDYFIFKNQLNLLKIKIIKNHHYSLH
eukprot:527350_1